MKDHSLAVNTIMYALSQGDAFVQVVGEVGSGKTMALRYTIDKIKDIYLVCYIPNGQMSSAGLFSHMMHELSLDPPPPRYGKLYQLEDIHRLLLQHYNEGKRCVVFVDEAQTFSDHGLELLRLMTNLETSDARLMQIVLFGQPELKKMLSQPHLRQLAQRIHYRVNIGAASFEDVEAYLSQRLQQAGHQHGRVFTRNAVKSLYYYTRGTLRLVNIVAHKAMLSAYAAGRNYVATSDVLCAVEETGYIHPDLTRFNLWNYFFYCKMMWRK